LSPRAAWRFETLGFAEVYDYMPGKLDWLAYGLPVERAQRNRRTLIDCLERNVPTAKMTETIGTVLPRLQNSKFRVLPVINDCNVLLGLIADRPKTWISTHQFRR
jgi:CBS-domain-containing membrane protein